MRVSSRASRETCVRHATGLGRSPTAALVRAASESREAPKKGEGEPSFERRHRVRGYRRMQGPDQRLHD